MFNWNDLVFFLELARRGRLTPAARRLHVDYTTVSRRVSELEKDLAVSLFERRQDGFVMTEEGHQLFALAEQMETLGHRVQETIMSPPREPSGRVRLATMEGIAAYYLSEKLAEFNVVNPKILVELAVERYLVNLSKREADVSLSFVPLTGSRLKIYEMGHFRLCLYASDEYLSKRGTPATIDDLRGHDFIDYITDLVSIPEVHWLLDILEPENVVFRSSSMAAQQNAVACGRGIALLPLFSAKKDSRLIPVLPDIASVERGLFLAVHDDIACVSRVRFLTRFLRDQFSKDCKYLNDL
jgi:DNA-binding transcriptional LysR family regulator